ncbi:MAG: hypothetical protein DRH20_11150 [Deltaproteobacteria bacterium]|nr:MAG: hypothetical protein DRH20_11150 [Deltaproteobacteria bacterium]
MNITNLQNRLDRGLQNFLTCGSHPADPETLRKIRFLNAFCLACVVVAPLAGLFYFFAGAALITHLLMAVALLNIWILIFLRVTKNPRIMGNFGVFVVWAALVFIRWNTGAMAGESLGFLPWVWNAVLILLAVYMTGYLWGSIWACLVFVESGLAVYFLQAGREVPGMLPAAVAPAHSLGAYLLGLLVTLMLAFLYERDRQEAYEREELKNDSMRELRRFAEDLLERSPVPTFVVDRNHRVIQWNRACREITGVPAEEILGKSVWDGFFVDDEGSLVDKYLEDPEGVLESYSSAIVSKSDSGSFAMEVLLPKFKGGTVAILNTAPIRDDEGGIRGVIQTIQDVGDHTVGMQHHDRRIPAAIQESLPVFEVDKKGKISAWNPACERLFGYPASRMTGGSPLQFISKPYRPGFRETVVKALQGDSFSGQEWKCYAANGDPIYVVADVYPVRTSSGQVRACAVVNMNVTHLKMRVKKLERYAVDCKEKLGRLTEEYDLLQRNIASFIRKKE